MSVVYFKYGNKKQGKKSVVVCCRLLRSCGRKLRQSWTFWKNTRQCHSAVASQLIFQSDLLELSSLAIRHYKDINQHFQRGWHFHTTTQTSGDCHNLFWNSPLSILIQKSNFSLNWCKTISRKGKSSYYCGKVRGLRINVCWSKWDLSRGNTKPESSFKKKQATGCNNCNLGESEK